MYFIDVFCFNGYIYRNETANFYSFNFIKKFMGKRND